MFFNYAWLSSVENFNFLWENGKQHVLKYYQRWRWEDPRVGSQGIGVPIPVLPLLLPLGPGGVWMMIGSPSLGIEGVEPHLGSGSPEAGKAIWLGS